MFSYKLIRTKDALRLHNGITLVLMWVREDFPVKVMFVLGSDLMKMGKQF